MSNVNKNITMEAKLISPPTYIKYKTVPFVRVLYLFAVHKCCNTLPVFLIKQTEHVY